MGDGKQAKAFYQQVLDLDVVMDQGWIVTLASHQVSHPQLSIMSEGGAGAVIPDVSIDVDDVDAVYKKATMFGGEIVYELRDEPWGVRRFFVRDPLGKILNIMSHL